MSERKIRFHITFTLPDFEQLIRRVDEELANLEQERSGQGWTTEDDAAFQRAWRGKR